MKIYKYRLSDFSDEAYDYWYGLLHTEKKLRVDEYRSADDKRRSVCAHMLAVRGISEHTGLSFDEVRLAEDENGKPFCKNANAFFSISHADDMVICAVSNEPVGIDVEKPISIKLSVTRRVCTPTELEYVFGYSPAEDDFKKAADEAQSRRFFEIWVKKEAFGKREGTGIAYNMKETELMHIPCFYEDGYVFAVC